MSRSIHAFIPCLIPSATAQMKKVAVIAGRPRFYKPKAVKQAADTLWALFQPYAPEEPLKGPLCLTLTLTFPWRKSERKGRVAQFRAYPIDTRPDLDNLFKQIADTMTSLRFWHDDSQLSAISLSKRWGDKPGISFCIASDLAVDKDGNHTSPEA